MDFGSEIKVLGAPMTCPLEASSFTFSPDIDAMSKPKSILKKPSGSLPSSSSSKHPGTSLKDGAQHKGKAKANGSKLRQSISVKPSKRSRQDPDASDDSDSQENLEQGESADGDDFGAESELDTDEEISRSKEGKGKTVRTSESLSLSACPDNLTLCFNGIVLIAVVPLL